MRLNRRGISLVEIIVTIALISVVLIFLMNLFIKVRGIYNNGKVEADYEMLRATIVKAIGDDIEKYGLISVEKDAYEDKVTFTYNALRESNLAQNVKKVLRVYDNDGEYFISYIHEYDNNLTTQEKTETVIRKIPDDSIVGDKNDKKVIIKRENGIVEVKIPIYSGGDIDYSINIYGLLD